MAPALHRRDESTALKVGLISAAVIASVSVIALVVYLTIGRLRNKQFLEACKKDPYLTKREFSRRRKLSVAQRIEEEEDQRRLILRKTLNSRQSSRNRSEAGIDSNDRHPSNDGRRKSYESESKDMDREREMKAWEAGLGQEQERDVGENRPFLDPRPVMMERSRPKPHVETLIRPRRSNSLTRTPLLAEPDLDEELDREPERALPSTRPRNEDHTAGVALWERRQHSRKSANHEDIYLRGTSPAPVQPHQHKSVRAATAEVLPPTGQFLRVSSGQVKAVEMKHIKFAPPMRARAASMEPLNPGQQSPQPTPPSGVSINSSSLTTPPPSGPLPPVPGSGKRARSHSAAPSPFPDLVFPPPPTVRIRSTSPQKNGFLSPDMQPPISPLSQQRDRSLSWDRQQRARPRATSHENLLISPPPQRIRSVSPTHMPRRKPVPSRSVTPKASSDAIAPATELQPVRTLSRRPSASSIMATPVEFIAKTPLPTTRVPVPTRAPSVVTAPEDESTIVAENTLPPPEKAFMGSPNMSDHKFLPSQSPRHVQSEAQLRRHRSPPPPQIVEIHTSPLPQAPEEPEGPEEPEEELVQFRGPGLLAEPSSPEPARRRTLRQTQSQQCLPVPRSNRNRSHSVENEKHSAQHGQLKPTAMDAASRRLRSRSFDNRPTIAPGNWQLQVSILDQTGAGFRRSSRSPSPSPPQPSDGEEETEDNSERSQTRQPARHPTPPAPNRQIRLLQTAVPVVGDVPGLQKAGSVASSESMASPPQPQTPGTPDMTDAAVLCRANFASPVKAKILMEIPPQAPSKPPPPPLFYAPMPGAISHISPPLFYSPDFTATHGLAHNPNTQYDGRGRSPYIELNYGYDTMKETFGSVIKSPSGEEAELSGRLSGPPEMPAFF
ncbi:hypothetical protein jhhlp_007132 [Lomentospora prolificans]|uniref:Uncharacterized protein n=1 Tax=Lomentospora prolificans TaxID=41688 RepID=A0A2N3N1S6_9PEZI|nr:hypothetical protein jhhlp_007132 [Lomentospora prolificans]